MFTPKFFRVQPRFLRLRDAPGYLGVDKNRFSREIRPQLTEIPIGRHGKAFDRLELDAWADQYKDRNGRSMAPRSKPWDENEHRVSSSVVGSGISTSGSEAADFAKALEKATSTRRKRS